MSARPVPAGRAPMADAAGAWAVRVHDVASSVDAIAVAGAWNRPVGKEGIA